MLSQWYHIYNVLVLFPSGAQLTLVTGPFLINRTKLKSKPSSCAVTRKGLELLRHHPFHT
jgi:hypothetical protein